MEYKIKRTNKEIDELLNTVADLVSEGKRRFPGMSYEQGIEAAIRWVTGESDDNPMDD